MITDDTPVLIAEALADALNAEFVDQFVAARRLTPEYDKKQINELKVCVVPGPLEASEIINETHVQNDWLIGIGFQQLVKRGNDDEALAILQIVKRVRTFIQRNRILEHSTAGEFLAIDITYRPYYDQELLQSGQLFSVIEIVYREWDDLDDEEAD